LEATALKRGLGLHAQLPQHCFLSLNVGPAWLTSEAASGRLGAHGSLSRLVLELTEHEAIDDYQSVVAPLAELLDRLARVAIDDAGSGYAGLQWLLALGPDLVKLDRALVADLDRDPAKLTLARLFGALTGGMDAWLLAEGIERPAELDALVRLGVPLGQGYVLGRPGPAWATPENSLSGRTRDRYQLRGGATVAALVEDVPAVAARHGSDGVLAPLQADHTLDEVMVVDDLGRPVHLIRRQQPPRGASQRTMAVKADESVIDLAARAVAGLWRCGGSQSCASISPVAMPASSDPSG